MIIVSELPYQVNKATLIEKIADLVKDRKIVGISDLRDESDRHGMRIVIELTREGQAASVLNQLYKHTAMQSSFAVNMVSLDGGQPKTMGLKSMLEAYIDHRRDVIRRRTEYELEQGARARAPAPRLPHRAEGSRQDHRPHSRRGIRRRREGEDAWPSPGA